MEEIDNATQVLVNNGFNNKEINYQVRKIIDKWYKEDANPIPASNHQEVRIFYKNQWHRNYKKDESALRDIINNNVKPVDNITVRFIMYYKSKKTCNLILKNNPSSPSDLLKRRNVVYKFKCSVTSCTHEYIGMTTMRLSKRISCHVQEGAIFSHYRNNHNCKPARDTLINCMEILDSNSCQKRLRYLEALYILEQKPSLNCTQEPLLLPTMLTHRPNSDPTGN